MARVAAARPCCRARLALLAAAERPSAPGILVGRARRRVRASGLSHSWREQRADRFLLALPV
jgi:hypothetical protein